jgi:hypothetical protein
MADIQQQSSAWASFQAFKTHLPASWYEDEVSAYNQIVVDFESAYGVDLCKYKIADDEMGFRKTSVSRIGFSGTRRPPQYASKCSCNKKAALRKLEALSLFLQDLKR